MNDNAELAAEQVAIGAFLRARRAPSGSAEVAQAWLKTNGEDLDALLGHILVRLHQLEDRVPRAET